jgi:hypothetical protein
MTEQNLTPGPDEIDDIEGHVRRDADETGDDTEGHVRRDADEDGDDVEGHARHP